MKHLFRQHRELENTHALLSASKSAWLNYDDEKLVVALRNAEAAKRGTLYHKWAHDTITLGIKQANTKQTLNMYVNDCIGFGMQTEIILVYSANAYGTADAIDFVNNTLRIFDLKTGVNKTSENQLLIYAALFCLEYRVRPLDIQYDLRIYQNDDVVYIEVDPEDVVYVMSRIQEADKVIEASREV